MVGADGIAVILRQDDLCHYVAEDSFEPLWAGQLFLADHCVSGWSMEHRETAVIPNVFTDPRVPVDAYRKTFVKSMIMVPIGYPRAVAAVGAYWSQTGQPSVNEIALLEALARSASAGLENGRLLSSLEQLNAELEDRVAARTAELERTQAMLQQTQKIEAIGQLTGNVAHDFNNLLAPIMSGLDLVLVGHARPQTIARGAAIAMEAAETAKVLVQRLLAFARRQPLMTTAVELDQMIDGMRDLLVSTIGSQIQLHIDIAPDLPAVRADRHQLEIAVLNLIVNARDAMPDGGKIMITATSADELVRLEVRDTRCGMDDQTKASAIEPFFTTKEPGRGTGLGLSMVDGLARQLGGTLDIDSKRGVGTAVLMSLPAIAPDMLLPSAPADETSEQKARGSISASRSHSARRTSTPASPPHSARCNCGWKRPSAEPDS